MKQNNHTAMHGKLLIGLIVIVCGWLPSLKASAQTVCQLTNGTGGGSSATGVPSFARGSNSNASGNYSTAIGVGATATGLNAIAVGNAFSTYNSTISMGYNATSAASKTIAVGSEATALDNFATALGYNASANKVNGVALGSYSQTGVINTGAYTINGGSIAGTDASAVVSVGSSEFGLTRQIQYVGAGVVSATSTNAVNGSQLYAVGSQVNTNGAATAAALGGGSRYTPTGGITAPSYNLGGATYNDVGSALAACPLHQG